MNAQQSSEVTSPLCGGDPHEMLTLAFHLFDFDGNDPGWSVGGSAAAFQKKSGSTPSGGTGPNSGFGGSGSYYYAETSWPRIAGDKFTLAYDGSACAAGKTINEINFKYHMYGSSMGEMEVLAPGGIIWTLQGDQGNSWKSASITGISVHSFTFEYTRGNSFRGDAAIDEVSIVCGDPDPNAPTAPPTAAPTAAPTNPPGTFTFDVAPSDPQGGWTRPSGTFDFTAHQGQTPSGGTGPSSGFGGAGAYMYAETSSPRRAGDVFGGHYDGSVCSKLGQKIKDVHFEYSMYGRSIGSFALEADGATVWSKSGNQGTGWHSASATAVDATAITFKYTRGSSYTGDAALDHIVIVCG